MCSYTTKTYQLLEDYSQKDRKLNLSDPPTEIEIAETITVLNALSRFSVDVQVIRRLVFQRDILMKEVEAIRKKRRGEHSHHRIGDKI